MLVTLEKVTLDVKTGVKLVVRTDGVVEVAPDAGPVRARGNGAAEPAKEEAPAEEAPTWSKKSVAEAADETEARVQDIMMKLPDPYRWRTYAEIMEAVNPGIPHRKGEYPSHEYNMLNLALRRLRSSHVVDVRKIERTDGLIGRRNLYRLHKEPDVVPTMNSIIPDDLDYIHTAHN
jgi:hypothetical protein